MFRVPLLALFLLVAFTSVLRAQSTNASLTGRVTDPAKAVIVDAKVSAISVDTNVRYETTTNSSGQYQLASLPPGLYRIEIEKAGFKKLIKPDVILHVQDALGLDFEMTVGLVSETVTVEAGAPLVNTESAAISTVVDRTFVENLPLNGRSFQSLIALTPGVVLAKATFAEQGQFSVNGQRADANYFTVDGVSANISVSAGGGLGQGAAGALPGVSAFGGMNNLVSVDALEEFKIQTSTYAPEFGRTPGGQVQISTRSGTNDFHGTLFEYFRNDVLDANNWFNNALRLPKPALRQNDFGGVLGGPIVRNRTFFFFSYEGLRLRQPQTMLTIVPTAAARQSVPANLQPYLTAYPLPNGTDFGNGTAQFNASYSNPSTLNAISLRVDSQLTSRINFWGRYNYAPSSSNERGPFGTSVSALSEARFRTQTLTLGSVQSISPRISNELRANYSRNRATDSLVIDTFGGAVPPPDSAFFPTGRTAQESRFLFFVNGLSFYVVGHVVNNLQRQINLVDNLSAVAGAHQLKLGFDYRHLSPLTDPPVYTQQVLFFGGVAQAQTGVPTQVLVQASDFPHLHLYNVSIYGQDTWKVTPRLTLTYGLRWEINPAPSASGAFAEPLAVTGADNPATLALAPQGTPLYKTTYNNLAPRMGFAYQLSQRHGRETNIRGGFGVFYDLGAGPLGNILQGFPFSITKTLNNTPFPLSDAQATPPSFSLGARPISAVFVYDPNLKLPRTYQWNLTVEQAVGANQVISASYVGAVGRRLLRAENLINPNPTFNLVQIYRNNATSDYHALQLQFRRRLSRGLQALASYTWSHSIDTASNDSSSNVPTELINPQRDRGPSDFDVRHSFSAAVTYNLPSPTTNHFANAVLSNWALDSIFYARSANPVNVVTGTAIFGVSNVFRPHVIEGIPLYLNDPLAPGGRRFNDTVDPSRPGCKGPFCPPPAGQQGSLGRNALRGFSATQLDFSLRRQFDLTERFKLQLRADFFNIFNHPNFGDPNPVLNQGTFGRSIQTLAQSLGTGGLNGGFNPLYQIGGPRSIQLAMKLQF